MRVALTDRFQREVRALAAEQRAKVFEAMLGLASAMGDVHRHAGLGLRKLHASGIWEARVGLGLRMVFAVDREGVTLAMVGNHEDVRRYLRAL